MTTTLLYAVAVAPAAAGTVALVVCLTARPARLDPPPPRTGHRYEWPVWSTAGRHRSRTVARRRRATPSLPPRRVVVRFLAQDCRRRLAADWREQLAWQPA